MKALILYDYPAGPAGLATQGDLLYRGLSELGVDVHAANFEAPQEKEWYYRWFKPDIVVGIGYWGHTPYLIQHPQSFGVTAVPWFVADGYIANYQDVLNDLSLMLVTSTWVKEMYVRDGINPGIIDVLPVGCETEKFVPRRRDDPKVRAIREALGVADDEIFILTVGGDAASKGGQEVMRALSKINAEVPNWKYVCKVWPQPRTEEQNKLDLQLAADLGIDQNVIISTGRLSRNIMPYLLAACDIYAAPSRLEGFGMIQVEANACGKPVVAIDAMAFRDTMVHGETAFLAGVDREVQISEALLGPDQGFEENTRVVFPRPRTSDFRANVDDIATHLSALMQDAQLRERMGKAGRNRVVELFEYRTVAKRFMQIISDRMGIS